MIKDMNEQYETEIEKFRNQVTELKKELEKKKILMTKLEEAEE